MKFLARSGADAARSLSVAQKILGVVSLLMVIAVGITSIGIYQLKTIGTEIEAIAERDLPMSEIVGRIMTHQLEQAIMLERILRFGKPTSAAAGIICARPKKLFIPIHARSTRKSSSRSTTYRL